MRWNGVDWAKADCCIVCWPCIACRDVACNVSACNVSICICIICWPCIATRRRCAQRLYKHLHCLLALYCRAETLRATSLHKAVLLRIIPNFHYPLFKFLTGYNRIVSRLHPVIINGTDGITQKIGNLNAVGYTQTDQGKNT